MLTDKKQILLGGINYYGKFLPNRSRRLRPINPLLKQGASHVRLPPRRGNHRTRHPPRTCRITYPRLPRLGRRRRDDGRPGSRAWENPGVHGGIIDTSKLSGCGGVGRNRPDEGGGSGEEGGVPYTWSQ